MSGVGSGTADLGQETAHRVPGALGDLGAVRERDALVLQLAEDVRRPLVEPEVRAERAGAVPQLPDVEQRIAIRTTSPGWRPMARSPATIRAGARLTPQSTSVTDPSSSTSAKEFVAAAPMVGMRTTPGASSIAGTRATPPTLRTRTARPPGTADVQQGDKTFRRDRPVRVGDDLGDLPPVDPRHVEVHTQPASPADVRRPEEPLRVAAHQRLLRARWGGSHAVVVVAPGVGHEHPAHEPRRLAVAPLLSGLG